MFASACGSVCVAFSRYDWMSKRAPLCHPIRNFFIISAGALSHIFPRFALGAYIFSNVHWFVVLPAFSASYSFKIFFHFWLAPIPCLILHNQLHNHSPWNLKASSGRHEPHQRGFGGQEAVKKYLSICVLWDVGLLQINDPLSQRKTRPFTRTFYHKLFFFYRCYADYDFRYWLCWTIEASSV